MNVNIRRGTPDDAASCGTICYEAFRTISELHNFPRDFPSPDAAIGFLSQLFTRNDVYSAVAEVDDRVVGSNFLWEDGLIAGVGPITVDPVAQNVAVGKRLMENVMQRASERRFAGVRLIQAAYHNRSLSLYTKLGFDTREPLSVMQGEPLHLAMSCYLTRPATENDVDACGRLCARVHGHERRMQLLDAIGQGVATVVENQGRITGYTTGIGFLGHAVGETNADLQALIGAAQEFPGPGFLLPTRNSELMRWCLAHGLRVVMPMTLMTSGLYNEPNGAFLPSVIY